MYIQIVLFSCFALRTQIEYRSLSMRGVRIKSVFYMNLTYFLVMCRKHNKIV